MTWEPHTKARNISLSFLTGSPGVTTVPDYRRFRVPGCTVFLTLVTLKRRPLFANPENVDILRKAFAVLRQESSFSVDAAVILPDHMHFLWTLPRGDPDYSKRIGRLKVLFTRSVQADVNPPNFVSKSRQRHRESSIWQRRFWEHTIRDEADFQHHMDYIHFNPVKHGLVSCAHQWPHSSFHRWVMRSVYPRDWCCQCDQREPLVPDFRKSKTVSGNSGELL